MESSPRLHQSYPIRGITLRNRLVVSPMYQYSCEARAFLRNPYFPLHAAKTLGSPDDVRWQNEYARAKETWRGGVGAATTT